MPPLPSWMRATRTYLAQTPLRFAVKHYVPRVEDTGLRKCPCTPAAWRARHEGRSTYRLVCLRCGRRFQSALHIPTGTIDSDKWTNVPSSDVFVTEEGYFRARKRDYRHPPDGATADAALAQEEPLRPYHSREKRTPVAKRRRKKKRAAPPPKRLPKRRRRRKHRKPAVDDARAYSMAEVGDLLKAIKNESKGSPPITDSMRYRRRNARKEIKCVFDSSDSM